MATFTIPSIYTVIDKFTSPVTKMMSVNSAFANSAVIASARANRAFRSVQNTANSMFDRLTGGYGPMAIASGFTLAALAANKFVSEASKIEDATARFTPLLGSVEKATDFVNKLNKEAASTPFQFAEIADVTGKFLPALKNDTDEAIRLFRMLGDSTGGDLNKLIQASNGLNKALLKQKIDMESLNMIAEAGIPIFPALAKTMGLAENKTGDIFKMISSGKIPTSALIKTFEELTSKGGAYFQGMAIQSQTFTGKLSSMWDSINMAFGQFGDAALPILKEYVDKVADIANKAMLWAQANKELIKTKVIDFVSKLSNVATFLIDNFDTIVTITKFYLGTLIALKTLSMGASIAMGALTTAQWLLNAAMTANPIGLIIAGVVILIGVVTLMITYWEEWGAALAFVTGPLGMIVSLIQALRTHWDGITEAFASGDILRGIAKIGWMLMDTVLTPLQQVLQLIAKFTGSNLASKAVEQITGFREHVTTALNPVADRQNALVKRIEQSTNTTTRSTLDLNVNDPHNYLSVRQNSITPKIEGQWDNSGGWSVRL